MYTAMQSNKKTDSSPTKLFNYYQNSSLARMINFINEAIVVLNMDGIVEMLNSNASDLLGARRERIIGENFLDYIESGSDKNSLIKRSLNAGKERIIQEPPIEVTLQQEKSGDQSLDVELSISSLPEEFSSSNSLFLCILRDMTVHKAEYTMLKRKAETDFLTGLANRHKFSSYISQQWSYCVNNNLPISLLMIDIDHFKRFNDEYGHVAGDRCLKRIGDVLSLSLPNRDALAARYGGEEFAIVLPNCHAQNAQLLAMRLKRHFAQLSIKLFALETDTKLTVSIGVATHHNHRYASPESLINGADTLLYQAKAQGRNQICYL